MKQPIICDNCANSLREVAEVRALAAKATPRPWNAAYSPDGTPCIEVEGSNDLPFSYADAEFIAAARNTIPALLDEIEWLRLLLNGVTASVSGLMNEIQQLQKGAKEFDTEKSVQPSLSGIPVVENPDIDPNRVCLVSDRKIIGVINGVNDDGPQSLEIVSKIAKECES